jgi:hypothetical protein
MSLLSVLDRHRNDTDRINAYTEFRCGRAKRSLSSVPSLLTPPPFYELPTFGDCPQWERYR